MKSKYIFWAAALPCASMACTPCGDGEDPATPGNQEQNNPGSQKQDNPGCLPAEPDGHLAASEILKYVNASTGGLVALEMALVSYGHPAAMRAIAKISDKKVKLVVPNGVTETGDAAFYICSFLAAIAVPGGAARIGEYAFDSCPPIWRLSTARRPSTASIMGFALRCR